MNPASHRYGRPIVMGLASVPVQAGRDCLSIVRSSWPEN